MELKHRWFFFDYSQYLFPKNAWDAYIDSLANQLCIPKFYLTNFEFKEKATMKVFNWVLVNAYEEGSEPSNSGTITATTESSAREFIIRALDEEEFNLFKLGDYILVLTEMGSW